MLLAPFWSLGYIACVLGFAQEQETHPEPALAAAAPEFSCQFERTGYFVADRYDHSAEHPVFNRAVGLRDSWAKMNK